MQLAGVRRQLGDARLALVESAAAAAKGEHDPAYRAALRSRNLVFHAMRGLAIVRKETPPEMPFVGIPGGGLDDHRGALDALDAALAVADDRDMAPHLEAARLPYCRYLGWLREEVARHMRGGSA